MICHRERKFKILHRTLGKLAARCEAWIILFTANFTLQWMYEDAVAEIFIYIYDVRMNSCVTVTRHKGRIQ